MSVTEKKQRPVFMIDNHPYVSSGIIVYTVDQQGVIYFLMQRTYRGSWRYEDFGGKSEAGDASLDDVAFREFVEETNNHKDFPYDMIRAGMSHPGSRHCIPECKYILYVVRVPASVYESVQGLDFGDHETCDNIKRDVLWISYKELFETPDAHIHPRIVSFKRDLPLELGAHGCV